MNFPKLSLLLLLLLNSLYAPSDCYTYSAIRMFPQHQIIEHIVLFKVKPDVDSTKIGDMVDELNGLASINLTIHVSAGELLRSTSTSSLTFTHIFHCYFRSINDLKVYLAHPDHLRVGTDILPIIEDIMSVDWISNCSSDSPKPGSAMRVVLLKLKQDLVENEKSKLVDQVIEEIKNQFKSIEYISFGENFSNAMSKGYSIAIMAVFSTPADFETLEVKLKGLIENELVVDYVLPPPNVANQFSFSE